MQTDIHKYSDIDFSKIAEKSPLAGAINSRLSSSYIKQFKKIISTIGNMHLKNTVIDRIVSGRTMIINGHKVVNFGSACYLGLDQEERIFEAHTRGLYEWGSHSGCSRLFSAHSNLLELEMKLCEFFKAEKVLIGPNTATTHIGVLPVLFGNEESAIFIDRFAHASLRQAASICVASGAKTYKVTSKDIEKLKRELKKNNSRFKVLLVDGVYSMQGNIAPLKELDDICKKTNTILYIDDAHGVGVYGPYRGSGTMEELELDFSNIILTGGFAKAFSQIGGFVASSSKLIDIVRFSSTTHIFSGPLQPSAIEGIFAALKICTSDEGKSRRQLLRKNSKYLRKELRNRGFDVPEGDSPIIPVKIGPNFATLLAGYQLFTKGYYVSSALYPAVPKGEGILRISLNSIHTTEQIDGLIKAFESIRKKPQKELLSLSKMFFTKFKWYAKL